MTGGIIGGASPGGGGVSVGTGGLPIPPMTPPPSGGGPTPPSPIGATGVGIPGVGSGGTLPSPRGAAGVTQNITNKNVQVHNHFKHGPPDTHTWSSGINWELGAMA